MLYSERTSLKVRRRFFTNIEVIKVSITDTKVTVDERRMERYKDEDW